MDASSVDVDVLIDTVRSRPILWSATEPDYYDKSKKRRAWEEVGLVVCPDIESKSKEEQSEMGGKLMKKWKNIRDAFLRAYKKRIGQGANSTRPYLYASHLDFLIDSNTLLATNISVKEYDEIQTYPEDQCEVVEEANTVEPVTQPINEPMAKTNPSVRRKVIKKTNRRNKFGKITGANRRRIFKTNPPHYLIAPTPTMSTEVTNPLPDDDRSFFDSLVPIVKILPLGRKLEFRCRVMELLKEMSYPYIYNPVSLSTYVPQQQTSPGNQPQTSTSILKHNLRDSQFEPLLPEDTSTANQHEYQQVQYYKQEVHSPESSSD